jgi:hypothetical protein
VLLLAHRDENATEVSERVESRCLCTTIGRGVLHYQQTNRLSHTTARCDHVNSVSTCPRSISLSHHPFPPPSPCFSADAHTPPSAGSRHVHTRAHRRKPHHRGSHCMRYTIIEDLMFCQHLPGMEPASDRVRRRRRRAATPAAEARRGRHANRQQGGVLLTSLCVECEFGVPPSVAACA